MFPVHRFPRRAPGGRIEDVLLWQPGSLERAHSGGEPELLPVPAHPGPLTATEAADDPADDTAARLFPGDTRHDRLLRNIWRYGADLESVLS